MRSQLLLTSPPPGVDLANYYLQGKWMMHKRKIYVFVVYFLLCRLDAAIAAAEGEVDLAIVDIDDLADIALEHGVNAVPTVIGLKNGEIVDKFVGLVDEDKLSAFIAKLRG